ncbi:Protein PTHB1, partial [Toxocara canis]
EQLVVGNNEGRVWVIDPGRVSDSRQQLSCLLEQTLLGSVIEISIAKFVVGVEQNFIAILFPQKLAIYRLVAEHDSHRLVVLHEHEMQGVAYNMCVGNFGRASTSQLCVQSVNCSLCVFECEHQLFKRNISCALHPGPIIYAPQSDSIVAASGGLLSSIKFSALAAASNTTHGKKLNPDWTFNLGDWPLSLAVIDTAPVQPSIVVLCKRVLLCFTHGGTLRFSIRLQCIATALLVYNSTSDAYLQLCIATTTRTLLFYADNILIWAAQLAIEPMQLNLCSFGTIYRSMVVILSERRLSIGYLGTEPSLFRLPASQTRFIDFHERQAEFMRLESAIRKKPSDALNVAGVDNRSALRFECTFSGLDEKSMARDVNEEVPSLTVDIAITSGQLSLNDVHLLCRTQFFAEQKYFVIANIRESYHLPITFYVKTQPITDLRCQFLLFSVSTGELCSTEIKLPLALMCRVTGTQRNVQYKLTFESSKTALEIGDLLPEFEAEKSTSIALQPILSDSIVSIFISPKSKRYRIQSDSLDALYVFADELISRVREKQAGVLLTCPAPLDHILQKLHIYIELEKRRISEESELERACTQLRGAQAAILAKLKAPTPASVAHIDALMQFSHSQLLVIIERVSRTETALRSASSSFSAALNLLHFLTSLNGKQFPINGYIVDCSAHTVSERLKWILSTLTRVDVNADLSSNELRSLIRSQCERCAPHMENIDEESDVEPEPELELGPEQIINPLVSGSLPFVRNAD